jgi:hypothetical protein
VTITFNNVVIHDGAIAAGYSFHDYQNKWDEIMASNIKHRLLCQAELEYSATGLIPLKITVNSEGALHYTGTTCNYTSSSINSVTDPSRVFGSSCDLRIDNKRNVKINKEVIDVAPLGWAYHVSNTSEFQCDIFMDPVFSSWIPGWFAGALREPLRTRF